MDKRITSFRGLIRMWPSCAAMQTDVESFRQEPKPRANVRDWSSRDSIPWWFWDAIILAAEARGYRGVTFALMTELKNGKATEDNG